MADNDAFSDYAKPGPYVTKLGTEDEGKFESWVKENRIPWQDDPHADYDMRGFWKAQQSGDPNAQRNAVNKHFPDTWKTPYHKTFSNESIYAMPDAPHWEGDKLVPSVSIPGTGGMVAPSDRAEVRTQGVKHTYFGYEKPGEPDYDYNSAHGIGDHGNKMTPHYSVALTHSQRKDLFGYERIDPASGKAYSTGQEFHIWGQAFRDDDTAPEADKRVDEYAPDYPHMSVSARAPETGTGDASLEKTPIQLLREAYPEFKNYTDEQLLAELKPKVAPEMSDEQFANTANSPDGQEQISSSAKSMSLMQQARVDFPEWKNLDDQHFQKRLYNQMVLAKAIDPKKESFQAFQNKLSPPTSTLTWLSNSLGDIGRALDKDSSQWLEQALSTYQSFVAGLYGAPEGALRAPSGALGLLDEMAKKVGLPTNIQKSYDGFQEKYLKTPFDEQFRKGLAFLNGESQKAAQASHAALERAKDANPVTKVTAEVAGSLPEMALTFGVGGKAKAAAEGAKFGVQAGRAIWSTLYQASAAYGKAVDATAKDRFMNQHRAGFVTALQNLIFDNAGARWSTGLLNAMINADYGDISNWLQGKPSHIGETGVATAVNFALAWLWGNPRVSEAPAHDLAKARAAWRQQDLKAAKELIDQGWSLMTDDESLLHAGHIVTLVDLLSDNTLRGYRVFERLKPEDLPRRKSESPIAPENIRQNPVVHAFDPETLREPRGVTQPIPRKPEAQAEQKRGVFIFPKPQETREEETTQWVTTETVAQPPPTPIDPSLRGDEFVKALEEREKILGETEVEKTHRKTTFAKSPLTKADTDRFTDQFFFGNRGERGAVGGGAEESMRRLREKGLISGKSMKAVRVGDRIFTGAYHAEAWTNAGEPKEGTFEAGSVDKAGNFVPIPLQESDTLSYKMEVEREKDWYRQNVPWGESGAAISPEEIIKEAAERAKLGVRAAKESGVGKFIRAIELTLDPGRAGPKAKEAEAEVGQDQAKVKLYQRAYLNNMFQRITDEDALTDLKLTEDRMRYVRKYNKEQRLQILFKASKGESTGDPIIDRMEEVRQEGMAHLSDVENAVGLVHDVRDNYIFRKYKQKHGAEEAEKFLGQFLVKYGDPSFMKPEVFKDFEHAYKFGFEPFYTDLEEFHQLRTLDHAKNITKLQRLEQWQKMGDAYETTQENIPQEAKSWPRIRSPKRKEGSDTGTTYFVHPEKAMIMGRYWDPMFDPAVSPWLDPTLGFTIRTLKGIKSFVTPFRLGLSVAHLMHLPQIRGAMHDANVMRSGMLTPEEAGRSALSQATLGVSQMVEDVARYGDLVKALQGKMLPEDLSLEDQWAMKQLLDSGFDAGFSHERELALASWMRDQLPRWLRENNMMDRFTELGLKGWTFDYLQRKQFGEIIPAIKAAAALEMIADLYRAKPELWDQQNETARLQVLRQIQQTVDIKLGEMNYDAQFTAKWVKGLGIGMFLSMAWQRGLIDFTTGGLKDLGSNVIHFGRTLEAARAEYAENESTAKSLGAGVREFVTARQITTLMYIFRAMVTGALLTGINMKIKKDGDKHQFTWMDFFNPWQGKKPNGEDQRGRTMNFPTEVLSILHDIKEKGSVGAAEKIVSNKLSADISAAYQALQNTNYLGQRISDSDLMTLSGIYDRFNYVMADTFSPIAGGTYLEPFKAAMQHQPAEQIKGRVIDAFEAFLGFSLAPSWTGRSALADEIITAHNAKGRMEGKSVQMQKNAQIRDDFIKSLSEGTEEETIKVIRSALDAGIKRETIEHWAKNRKVTSDKYAFQGLDSAKQIEFLNRMNHDERKAYWRYTHTEAKRKFIREYPAPTQ